MEGETARWWNKLRYGVAEYDPFFDQRSRIIYLVLVAQWVAIAIMLAGFGYRIAPDLLTRLPFSAVFAIFAAWLLRRYGHAKASTGLEATVLAYIQGSGTVLLLFPLTELSLDFADESIAAFDHFLGFHWPSFSRPFANDPLLFSLSRRAYGSFEWQALILVPLLVFVGRSDRAWHMVTAGTLGAVFTMAIYPFVPAQGPAIQYDLLPVDYPLFGHFPWQFGPDLLAIKQAGLRLISADDVFAMVSVPSYHTIAGVVFMWAAWPDVRLRLVFVPLNAAMIIATIPIGVHYLADLVAGAICAVLAILLSVTLSRGAGGERPEAEKGGP